MKTKNILSEISVFIIFLILVLSVMTAFGQGIDKASPQLYSVNNTTGQSNISKEIDASSPKLANATAGTECEKNGGKCIYFQDKCPEGYGDANMACSTRSEKCCIKICPEGCTCMTEVEAKAKFNGNYERCSDVVCGYGDVPTATAMIKTSKYCFKEKVSPTQCPQGCECLTDAAAKEKGMVLCKNESKRCIIPAATGAAVQYGHCYEKPVIEACHYDSIIGKCTGVCPDDKVCKRFYIVSKDMVRDEDTLLEYPADSFFDLFVEIDIPDPGANSFFDVFTKEEFVPGKTVCKCVSTKRCQYDAKLDKCIGGCPEGMKCRMFYVVNKTQVKDVDTGELLTPDEAGLSSGEIVVGKKVCKCVPLVQVKCRYDAKLDKCAGICPKDMKCRMFYVLSQKEVKDDEGNLMTPEEANISANELVVGVKLCKCVPIVAQRCHYDYDKNACVGECPPGEKCQLNTIYRNATTGEVIYAECHCKAPQVEKCPDNCKCLTKMAGYEQGLDLCNNSVTICGYVAPEALANAAPNALGIPKYCFGEKVYEKCPKSCECISKEEAYNKGYELCGGVKECGASGNVPLYCYQKPIEECGKDTLIVARKINPKVISIPSFFDVFLTVKPKKNISGVIITEIIPEGMEPAWDYSVMTFDTDVEEKIEAMPIASEIVKAINVKWTSRRPDSWDPKTREAKWIISAKDGIKPQTFMYKIKLEAEKNDAYKFTGNWLISSGENCSIIGDNTVTVKPPENWPPCTISDLELLQYIDLWSKGELTDMQILQAIYVWAKKPPCYLEKSIGGDEPWD